ncbi:PilZ domain-containing protein [Pseudophaeobacter sp.]|uniref:PilZ domain-containing protein n=1 Tax=Pseudophaeobacter sp. TaxID=1971739 RepID=UPI0032978FF7
MFDELTTLVHLSEEFLDDVETGADTGAAGRLSQFLRQTPVVDLRMRLSENGFDKISGPTSKYMALQKTLLKIRSIGGQFKAAETARKLRSRAKTDAYRKELVSLPCMDVNGNLRAFGDTSSDFLVSTQTASIGAVSILIFGVIAFILVDRIHKKNSGKKKRFLCSADCHVKAPDQDEKSEAQIVDVSQIGAKVKSEAACSVGGDIEVTIPEKKMVFPEHTVIYDSWTIPARVLWRKGDYLGLEFKGLLEKDHLEQLVSAS